MAEPNPNDAVEHLAELARHAASSAENGVERALSRQRFLARVDAELEPQRPRFLALRWALPAAAALGIAAVLLLGRAPELTFEVSGAELSGKYVSAPTDHRAKLRFSDESTVEALAGSRLRVEDTSPRGARVLLERGRTLVHVVHRDSTAWTFAAGPFEVHVTGTRFELAWDPARETCQLLLQDGSVEVRGPTGSGPLVVRAGQRFEGDAQRRTMQVLELATSGRSGAAAGLEAQPAASSAAQGSVPTEAPSAAPPSVEAPSAFVPPPGKPPREARTASWSELIAQGKFQSIVSEAETRGVAGCLASCSAADLRALSDAARYTGQNELAESSLLAVRRRFPGARGAEAAFLLGRLQERRGALSAARVWYDSYLREAPSGSFAAEALAGKLRAVQATEGRQAAQPLAREYLQRFPKGVHESTAREILGEK